MYRQIYQSNIILTHLSVRVAAILNLAAILDSVLVQTVGNKLYLASINALGHMKVDRTIPEDF